MRRHKLIPAVVISVATGLIAGAVFAGGDRGHKEAPPVRVHLQSGPATPGSRVRFARLVRQHSNGCGLQPANLMSMPKGARLQGSCCFPMDEAAYRSQVRALRKYAHVPQIPRDPFDVSVSLAKRLLRYRSTIRLTGPQRATYRRAMSISREKGPCCCRCWRWRAFEGMSDYLIARRGFGAAELARLIEAVDGCGGPADSSA